MKPLIIPDRFRRARCGYYVRCGHCRKNVTTKCGESEKKIHTCKHPENHRYQSKIIIPGTRKMKVKTWGKKVRDLQEFFKLHRSFVDSVDFFPEPDIKPRPMLLSDCMAWFADWFADVDVPEYQKKNNSEKYLSNQVVNLRHMKTALSEVGINPDLMVVTDFSEKHVGIVHEYLANQFSNKTINDKVATYRAFFKFLISEDYEMKNHWLGVRQKPTKANTDIISVDEFNKLCQSVKPENGVKIESKGSGRVGKKNLYRDYLVEAWELSLYSGCRPEELVNFKVSDIRSNHIVGVNFKVSRAKKDERVRMIPLFAELEEHISKIIRKRDLKTNDFLIAPEESNRGAVMKVISNAFSHYWNQLYDTKRRFYDLRNTFATAAIPIVGKDFSGRIGLHEKLATTIEHYQNEQKVLEELRGKKLFG